MLKLYVAGTNLLNHLATPLALALRLYVGEIFIRSGLIKLQSWDSTVALFQDEYKVPVLPPELAAVMGTGAELLLPPLLMLGLGSRAVALAMFVFNIVAAVSYPDLSEAGLKDHISWGVMIAVIIAYGPGKASLDYLLQRRLGPRYAC